MKLNFFLLHLIKESMCLVHNVIGVLCDNIENHKKMPTSLASRFLLLKKKVEKKYSAHITMWHSIFEKVIDKTQGARNAITFHTLFWKGVSPPS